MLTRSENIRFSCCLASTWITARLQMVSTSPFRSFDLLKNPCLHKPLWIIWWAQTSRIDIQLLRRHANKNLAVNHTHRHTGGRSARDNLGPCSRRYTSCWLRLQNHTVITSLVQLSPASIKLYVEHVQVATWHSHLLQCCIQGHAHYFLQIHISTEGLGMPDMQENTADV